MLVFSQFFEPDLVEGHLWTIRVIQYFSRNDKEIREFLVCLEVFGTFQKTNVGNKMQKQNKPDLSFILHQKLSKSIW